MSSKEHAHRDEKASSKPRAPKHSSEILDLKPQQQSLPATLIQRARLDPGSLTPGEVKQLQRAIGNQMARSLLTGKVQRQQAHDSGQVRVSSISSEAVQRKPLSPEQEVSYAAIFTAINRNKEGISEDLSNEIKTELKKLVEDDITILTVLTQVFVNQGVKLLGTRDEGAGKYNSKDNEMTIFVQGAVEMADTIIFESGNALQRAGYQGTAQALREKQPKGLEKVGAAKSDIESGVTLDYLDHILKMIESGRAISQLPPKAKRQYDHFLAKYPTYFTTDAKGKEQFREDYKQEMRESPHELRAEAGTRLHLTTKDLYSYEQVVQEWNIGALLTTVKGYIERKKGQQLNNDYFSGAKYKSDPEKKPPMIKGLDVPDGSRGKFYIILIERAEHYYKVDLSDIKFNAAQIEVAENEHRTTGWDPATAFLQPGSRWDPPPDIYNW